MAKIHVGWAWSPDALGCVAVAALAMAAAPAAAQGPARPTPVASGPAQWIERLRSEDFAQRLASSYDYSAFTAPSPQTLDLLIASLTDPDPRVREHVAAALGEIGGEPAPRVAALIGALRDSDAAVQSQAALALGKLGEPAASALVDALLDDAQLREPTTAALLWEDYAFAALARAEEGAAPAFARALVTLSERKLGVVAGAGSGARPAAAAPDPEAPRYAYPRRPALKGDELKLALFDRWKYQIGPFGKRVLADELLTAARVRAEPMRAELERLARESLHSATAANLIDPRPERAARLADFLTARPEGQTSYSDGLLGDISLLLFDRLVALRRDADARALLKDMNVSGPLVEQWVGRLETQLRSPEAESRQAAVSWLERNGESQIPVSESLLWGLIRGSDRVQAATGAGYLARLGDRSPELLTTLAEIAAEPATPGEAARKALDSLALFDEAALGAEDRIAALAGTNRGESHYGVQCKAAKLLRTLRAHSDATVAALFSASGRKGCAAEAVPALLALGKTQAEILEGARSRNPADDAPDAAFVAGFPEGEGDYDDIESRHATRLPEDVVEPMPAPELIALLRGDDILAKRSVSATRVRAGAERPYTTFAMEGLDQAIRRIEDAAPEDIDQRSPLFAALADLRIFKEIQESIESAADWRFDFAFPQEPLAAAAASAPIFVRLLPKWPWSWPPPKYSAWGVVDAALIPPNSTIGSVYGRLSAILKASGYRDNRLYGVKSGVAVVTHLEQTGPGGEALPAAQRWSYEPDRIGRLSFARYFADAFMGIRQHYRLFAFFLAKDADISGGQEELKYEEAKNPRVDGARVLPPEIAKIPWKGFYFHSVIYRYKKLNGTVTPVTSDVPSDVQLQKAGIAFSLQRRS